MLTTFQTPAGWYKWLRLPFGLAVSNKIFQKCLLAALGGLENVHCIVDNILACGLGVEEDEAQCNHDYNLERLLVRCRELGIKLNDKKTELKRDNIVLLGHQL